MILDPPPPPFVNLLLPCSLECPPNPSNFLYSLVVEGLLRQKKTRTQRTGRRTGKRGRRQEGRKKVRKAAEKGAFERKPRTPKKGKAQRQKKNGGDCLTV